VAEQGRYLILLPLLTLGQMRYWQLVFFTLEFIASAMLSAI
jgi:hypothetical protein